jgi:hypothetical protein
MHNFTLAPVAESTFADVVAKTTWNPEVQQDRLRATSLGWLALVDEANAPTHLVGFSVESPNTPEVKPPRDLPDVMRRLGRETLLLFNGDWTAKGLGSTVANTPAALQPRAIKDGVVAARAVPFTHDTEVCVRPESDTALARKLRLLRHGTLTAASALGDMFSRDNAGTAWAMRFMERDYGEAPLVSMPVPPIWLEQQQRGGIEHSIVPHVLLVRGGSFADQNAMVTLGRYRTPSFGQQ